MMAEAEAEDVLRVCTQTVFAQPLRALHEAAPGFLFCEDGKQMSVRLRFEEEGGVRVVSSKSLVMRSPDTLRRLRPVRMCVEFHSRKDMVYIGIS